MVKRYSSPLAVQKFVSEVITLTCYGNFSQEYSGGEGDLRMRDSRLIPSAENAIVLRNTAGLWGETYQENTELLDAFLKSRIQPGDVCTLSQAEGKEDKPLPDQSHAFIYLHRANLSFDEHVAQQMQVTADYFQSEGEMCNKYSVLVCSATSSIGYLMIEPRSRVYIVII